MTPQVSTEEQKRRIDKIHELLGLGFSPLGQTGPKGSAVQEAARQLGISSATLGLAIRQGRLTIDWKRYKAPKPEEVSADVPTQSERQRYEDKIADLSTKLRGVTRELNAAADIRQGLLGLKGSPMPRVDWAKPAIKTGATVLRPFLFTSDFQCGELIKADEIDGLNAYDMDIFADRYRQLIDRTIDLSEHHVGKATFPGIVYGRGGDAISGLIHDELLKTNDLQSVPAVKWLVRHERDGIQRLRDKFGQVVVYSIPGNHGRTQIKKESKGYVANNFETIVAWWLEMLFEGDPKVTFVTPPSGDAYFKVFGWHVLMSHGDRMGSSGGQGFIGPSATIARGHRKLYDNMVRTGLPVDYIFTGHFHTSIKLETGYGNGTLAGYSEYARDLRATPDAPKQWLTYFHERRGITAQYEVQVGERPRRLAEALARAP